MIIITKVMLPSNSCTIIVTKNLEQNNIPPKVSYVKSMNYEHVDDDFFNHSMIMLLNIKVQKK